MTSTVTPVIPTTLGGRASQPARASATACRSALVRADALVPVSVSTPPNSVAWLPVQPTTSTWTDAR